MATRPWVRLWVLFLLTVTVAGQGYYSVLGVEPGSSQKEVAGAFRRLSLRWHPDKHRGSRAEAERRMGELSQAYAVLGDPAERRRHDHELGARWAAPPAAQPLVHGGAKAAARQPQRPGLRTNHGDLFASSRESPLHALASSLAQSLRANAPAGAGPKASSGLAYQRWSPEIPSTLHYFARSLEDPLATAEGAKAARPAPLVVENRLASRPGAPSQARGAALGSSSARARTMQHMALANLGLSGESLASADSSSRSLSGPGYHYLVSG